jgi:hypothetical protein
MSLKTFNSVKSLLKRDLAKAPDRGHVSSENLISSEDQLIETLAGFEKYRATISELAEKLQIDAQVVQTLADQLQSQSIARCKNNSVQLTTRGLRISGLKKENGWN